MSISIRGHENLCNFKLLRYVKSLHNCRGRSPVGDWERRPSWGANSLHFPKIYEKLHETRMHSSRMRTARSSSCPGGLSTRHPLGSRPPTPKSRPPRPSNPSPTRHPPAARHAGIAPSCCKACWDTTCNACWDSTPVLQGMLGYHLQGMLGYHTPPLLWTESQTPVKI